jgi:hypothetical protein
LDETIRCNAEAKFTLPGEVKAGCLFFTFLTKDGRGFAERDAGQLFPHAATLQSIEPVTLS